MRLVDDMELISIERQLYCWLEGRPIHNFIRNECTPDFACCNKNVRTPLDERIEFAQAYLDGRQDIVNEMLSIFLERAILTLGDGDDVTFIRERANPDNLFNQQVH